MASDRNIYFCYRSFWPELERTADFAKMGVHTRCFFAANTVSASGYAYCKYPAIWRLEEYGFDACYDFDVYDRQVEDLLSADPDAEFICMVDLNTPYWLTRHMRLDSFEQVSHAACSEKWIERTTRWMVDFLEYSEKKYGDRIVAYVLSGGGTSEWYEYGHGRTSDVKNAAWRSWCQARGLSLGEDVPSESALKKAAHEGVIYDPGTEREKIEYWRFHNRVIADAILHFAKEARPRIAPEKEIGFFYGYYLVRENKIVSFGHLDYERVFASPDIDFFISPGDYTAREMGEGSGSQMVAATAQRYGKRHLHEIDHRTHAVERGPVSIRRSEWNSKADDYAGLKREAAFALVHHHSLWWFDMWGGFYDDEETRQLIGKMKEVHDKYVDDPSSSVAEVLMIADPESHYYVNEKPFGDRAAGALRRKVSKTGAPFDIYSFGDIPAIDLSRYKLVILPAMFLITPEREAILRDHVLKDGRTVLWFYAPGITDGESLDVGRVARWAGTAYGTPGLTTTAMEGWTSVYSSAYEEATPAVLKRIMADAGVHMVTDELNPVYANERLLAVHFAEGGPKTIHLPRRCRRVIDVYAGKTVAEDVSEFTYEFGTPDTVLFDLGG